MCEEWRSRQVCGLRMSSTRCQPSQRCHTPSGAGCQAVADAYVKSYAVEGPQEQDVVAGSSPQPVRAELEAVPYGHARQCSEPVDDENDPAGQRTQRYWPGRDLAKPGRQRRSVVPPPSSTRISTPALGTAAFRQRSALAYSQLVQVERKKTVYKPAVSAGQPWVMQSVLADS
jgi:hypothetical protein